MAPDPETSATLAAWREIAKVSPVAIAPAAIPRLLAALDAAQAALSRHQQWFKNENGTRICGGCLEPVPCKDTDVIGRALAGTGKEGGSDEH